MTLDNLLATARKHLGGGTMESSARLCLADAIEAKDRGDFDVAWTRATKSIVYSVGIFHPDYERAVRAFGAPSPAAGGAK